MPNERTPTATIAPKRPSWKVWLLAGACMLPLVMAGAGALAQTPPTQPGGNAVPVPPAASQDNFVKRLNGEAPLPGSEAALRHQIDAFAQGHPDLGVMTDRLAQATVPQLPQIERKFALMGPIQSLTFLGVGFSGFDVYAAKFATGMMISRILLTPDGKISGLLFQWGP